MASFEERISNETNKSIAGPIWENEKKTYSTILYAIKEQGHEQDENKIRLGDIIYYTDSETISYGEVRIQRTEKGIRYYIYSDEVGFTVLANVTPKNVKFPIHGTKVLNGNRGLEEKGELPLSAVKDTVRETIEKSIIKHPIMGKYADIILGDIDQILSLDSERQITPIPESAKIMAAQKREIERLKEENSQQKKAIETLMKRIKGIPFFGKRIVERLSKMLPSAEEKVADVPTTEENSDRINFVQRIDVPGISGIQSSEKSSEQVQTRPDSEIED